jgi:hypothetical protein
LQGGEDVGHHIGMHLPQVTVDLQIAVIVVRHIANQLIGTKEATKP